MSTITNNIITVIRGETAQLPVTIVDAEGNTYEPTSSDVITFTVKESADSHKTMIQKMSKNGVISLTTIDTDIDFGYYVYDIQLTSVDGYTITVVEPTSFIVIEKDSLAREIDIVKFLPSVTDQCRDILALCDAENVELAKLWDSLVNVFYNQFITMASNYGLSQWEKIFDVTPGIDETWEDRRFRILALIRGTRPYTDEKMEELLDILCGKGGYIIERDYSHYQITFKLNLGVKSQLNRARDMLEKIVPMNLGLTVTLNYNRHMDLKKKFTHGQMAAYTNKSLREDPL